MRDIPGYEGLYAADEEGNILSLVHGRSRRKRVLKPYENTGGYLRVNLSKDGKVRHEYVHRLVAMAYLENPEQLPQVNHLNADRQDNRPDNLEWVSVRANIRHALGLGRWSRPKPVVALNLRTGERREYDFLKDAAIDIFGKRWALNYSRKRGGTSFEKEGWTFEVRERHGV